MGAEALGDRTTCPFVRIEDEQRRRVDGER
jgi:hypothetical protein